MRSALISIALAFAGISLAQTPLAFEVATIKPHVLQEGVGVFKDPNPRAPHISGSRVTLQIVSLSDLILAAYNVKAY
jgi:uncharacterized protein (TIGR03435 family)